MTIEFGRWRVRPNGGRGCRCWEVYRGGATRAERFYDTLDRALLWCAEQDLRQEVDGDYDLIGALREYWRISQTIMDARQSAESADETPALP